MRRFLTVFAILLLAVPALAQEPWAKKAAEQWTMDDVQRILKDSPWSRMVWVNAPWMKGRVTALQGSLPGCGRPEFGDMKQPPGWTIDTPTTSMVAFQVTWAAAKTVRAAKFRLAVLCGRAEQEDAEDALANEPEEILVQVESPDMTPFDGMDEETLLKNASLQFKKSKTSVAPSEVTTLPGFQRGTYRGMTFRFPRQNDAGQPNIPAGEKDMEFVLTAGKTNVKARFNLTKMVAKSGPDI